MNAKGPCKILIASNDAYGHVNACLGIGAVLAKRGNEVYFLNNSIYKESAEKQGIKFIDIEDYSENSGEKGKGNVFAEMFEKMDDKPKTSEETESPNKKASNVHAILFDVIKKSAAASKKIIPELQIDILMGDFVYSHPFFFQCPVPFVPIMSTNPLVLFNGPPHSVGLSVNDDRAKWQPFIELHEKRNIGMMEIYAPWFQEAGLDVPTVVESRTYAKELGVYVFPEALDYTEYGSPKSNWVRMESAVRKSAGTEFEIPECLKDKPGKLIYFSLGSLGSGNLKLMNGLLETLSKSPNRLIVSKGGRGDEMNLPENMWGQNFLDQLAILPKVDLVITHGGSNTLLETLAAGKPLIVMPLFGDQLDNAQRIQDLGLGRRISPMKYEDEQLLQAIEDSLADTSIKEKVAAISKRLQNSDSGEKVAEYIERLARTRVSPI